MVALKMLRGIFVAAIEVDRLLELGLDVVAPGLLDGEVVR